VAKKVIPVLVQDEEQPVEKAVLAQAIVDISRGLQRLQRGGWGRETVAVLIHHHAKVPLRDVRIVLDNLALLEETIRK
jgi:hypothetical protein